MLSKSVVNKVLKADEGVRKTERYDKSLEEFSASSKSGFLYVFIRHSEDVVSLANVKLRKESSL